MVPVSEFAGNALHAKPVLSTFKTSESGAVSGEAGTGDTSPN